MKRLKNFLENVFFVKIAWKIFVMNFFFWRALALVSLVLGLGLEHSCPWPWECLPSERLSLALASDFFCVLGLGLKPCVLDSTSAKQWDCNMMVVNSTSISGRGGVEGTRLEAKAKDTKKIRCQGQGQPFRGQTLSRPRTGMLEAKAKDQGHKRKCSPKKKGHHKNFSSDLHKILTIKKIVLSSSRGQANFRGLEASRPRTSKCVLEAKDVLEDSTSD